VIPEPTKKRQPTRAAPVELGVARRDEPPPDSATDEPGEGLGIEVGAVTSARIGGDDHTSLSVGVLAFLDASSWLVGFQGRVAEYAWDPTPEHGDSWGTLELGLLLGRRIDFDTVALDLTTGPAVAIEAGDTTETRPADGDRAGPTAGPSTTNVPRWLFASHFVWSTRSTVRGFVGIEGELGPTGDRVTLDGPRRLPTWMVGLALGAVVGRP
jgi:hypothetical protein